MKQQKFHAFLEVSFKPNPELEKLVRDTVKRPFRFDGSGQDLSRNPQRDLTFSATAPQTKLKELRANAYAVRRLKGVKAVGFSVMEDIPRTAAGKPLPN